MKPHLVELIDVSLTYHEPHAETPAIKDLSFKIDRGEFVSIVGPSGCGKTSMLSLLAGLIKPSGGQVLLCGEEVSETSDRIGYMLQRDHLLDWRTIEENILLGLEVKHRCTEKSRARALALLETYGLSEFASHYPHQLSGGMRQ
ncbi:MAG: ATP-binding cassette domain-containing protein, partial [Clostridia bacterium]|nr:ATP-binding cassette domain-containing protein [Clostridia bacterium]